MAHIVTLPSPFKQRVRLLLLIRRAVRLLDQSKAAPLVETSRADVFLKHPELQRALLRFHLIEQSTPDPAPLVSEIDIELLHPAETVADEPDDRPALFRQAFLFVTTPSWNTRSSSGVWRSGRKGRVVLCTRRKSAAIAGTSAAVARRRLKALTVR